MKKVFFALTLAVIMFNSCGDGTLSLASYNQRAIAVFNAASEKWVTEREIVYEHKLSKEETAKLLEGLSTSLDEAIEKTSKLKYPEDAKDFHEAILNLYQFQKETLMPLLEKSQEFEPDSKEWYATWREFDKETGKVDKMLREMEKLQKELAEKAGVKLR